MTSVVTTYSTVRLSEILLWRRSLIEDGDNQANGKLVMYADDCQFLDSDSPDELGMLKERVESTLKIALKWFTQNRQK